MSSENDNDVDMSGVTIEADIDNGDTVVEVKAKKPVVENENVTPLEDRFGQSLWVPTRMCYCSDNAETDCRFHSQKEPGWEQCPNTELSTKNRNVKGRMLWARNPNYGKQAVETVEAELPKTIES